jgi:hypothetical protein
MHNFLSETISNIYTKRRSAILISVVITTLFYIFYPTMLDKSAIIVNSNVLILKLPSNFTQITLTFRNQIYISTYSIGRYIPPRASRDVYHGTTVFPVSKALSSIAIDNSIINSKDQVNKLDGFELRITLLQREDVHIAHVAVNREAVNLKLFFDSYIMNDDKKYRDKNYIREDIAKLLLVYNDEISNFLMTGMTIYLFPLAIEFTLACLRLLRRQHFRNFIIKKYKLSKEITKEQLEYAQSEFSIAFMSKDRRYQFLQIAGPAFGFVLTISSLIVGLHPSLRTESNMAEFFSAIQIAMMSTLIGLTIRIFAILLQKTNNTLFVLADEIFFDVETMSLHWRPINEKQIKK